MRSVTIGSRFLRARRRSVVRYRRCGHAGAVVALAVLSTSFGSVDASASPRQAAADPKVISDWNAVAFDTIVVDAGKANAEAFIWFAFEQAAVYNAVVGITRQYELYNWNGRGPRGASPQAAAAVAAHDVLLEYFPASQGRLDTALAASLAEIPDGPQKRQGIRYGQRAADRLIELREDDGRFAPVTFDVPPAPGVWRPTPPTGRFRPEVAVSRGRGDDAPAARRADHRGSGADAGAAKRAAERGIVIGEGANHARALSNRSPTTSPRRFSPTRPGPSPRSTASGSTSSSRIAPASSGWGCSSPSARAATTRRG